MKLSMRKCPLFKTTNIYIDEINVGRILDKEGENSKFRILFFKEGVKLDKYFNSDKEAREYLKNNIDYIVDNFVDLMKEPEDFPDETGLTMKEKVEVHLETIKELLSIAENIKGRLDKTKDFVIWEYKVALATMALQNAMLFYKLQCDDLAKNKIRNYKSLWLSLSTELRKFDKIITQDGRLRGKKFNDVYRTISIPSNDIFSELNIKDCSSLYNRYSWIQGHHYSNIKNMLKYL